jgi:hypothetical protein
MGDFLLSVKTVDSDTGKPVPIIEKCEIGLLTKEVTHAF